VQIRGTLLCCLALLVLNVTTAVRAADADELPSRYDLRDTGILTPVKHQSDCGSCGEFAAVAITEALIAAATGDTVDLSEQQIVSCVPGCGCVSGCSTLDALRYIRDHGIAVETAFPYVNADTACVADLPTAYRITDVFSTTINTYPLVERIAIIKRTILEYGPVATNMVLYDDLGRYRGGVYTFDGRAAEMGGHWVVLVGWTDDPKSPSGGYWICRNSWGERWGESGYFNSAYGDVTGIDDFYIVYAAYTPAGSAPAEDSRDPGEQ